MHDIHQRQPDCERPSRQGIKFVDMRSHSGRVTSAKLRSDAVVVDTSRRKEISKFVCENAKVTLKLRLSRITKKYERAKPSVLNE